MTGVRIVSCRSADFNMFQMTYKYRGLQRWKWGPRPRTSSRCYHGNKSAAPFKKSIFVHPPWAPSCMQNLKGGLKFSFPKMFDSYRDLFLSPLSLPGYSLIQTGTLLIKCAKKNRNSKIFWPKRQTLKLLAKCFIQAILLSLASYISDITSVLWHTHVPYNCRINHCIGETPTKWKIEIHTEGTNFGKNHHFILIRDTIEIDNVAVKIT